MQPGAFCAVFDFFTTCNIYLFLHCNVRHHCTGHSLRNGELGNWHWLYWYNISTFERPIDIHDRERVLQHCILLRLTAFTASVGDGDLAADAGGLLRFGVRTFAKHIFTRLFNLLRVRAHLTLQLCHTRNECVPISWVRSTRILS